jgi:hypothetical protein
MIGVSESQLADARTGKSDDAKLDAMLKRAERRRDLADHRG